MEESDHAIVDSLFLCSSFTVGMVVVYSVSNCLMFLSFSAAAITFSRAVSPILRGPRAGAPEKASSKVDKRMA